MALSPDTVLNNRYRVISNLGQGGMGSIYRAQDIILEIDVAIKENLFLSDEYARQFEQEARILASLRHPSLPRVVDYFFIPGQGQYLIMDYIQGEDLRERIERLGSVTQQDVSLIGIEICNALDYLHNRTASVLHRDIKPGNIKITPEGEIVLVDFGLAKVVEGDQMTRTGARAMTPGYSPPEQYGTARTDVRTDIYSLGATLYASLTGIIPEDGLDRATGKAKLTGLRQINPTINRRLAFAIEKSLSIEPENRYQNALEFKKALIEASDFSSNTRERPHITPPPFQEEDAETSGSDFQRSVPSRSRKQKVPVSLQSAKANRIRLRILLIILIAGLTTLLFYLRPALPSEVLASIMTTPTSSIASTNLNTVTPDSPFAIFTSTVSPTTTITPSPTRTYTPTRTLTPTITLTPTVTPDGGGFGQIIFASDRTGAIQLWLMNDDGLNQEQITNLPDGACQPDFSPDGSQIVFISPCKEKSNTVYEKAKIYIMNIDGTSLHLLPVTGEGDFDPKWSPDGTRLAFTSLRTGKSHIFAYNFSDGSLQELSDTRFPDMHPDWDPTGKQIAFVRTVVYSHIFIMSERGFTQFDFSSAGNVNDYWPDWSPDGSYIIYSRTSEEPAIPRLVSLMYEDRGTAQESPIPPFGKPSLGPVSGATLSPDGKWIAFESWPDGRNHDIFLMGANGENWIRLTNDPGFDFDAAWRPINP
jgi:eukaryotic-like serine/threonine-protein kinase